MVALLDAVAKFSPSVVEGVTENVVNELVCIGLHDFAVHIDIPAAIFSPDSAALYPTHKCCPIPFPQPISVLWID